MHSSVVGTMAALFMGLAAGVAQAADTYLVQMGDTAYNDTITGNTYKNGGLIQSVTFPTDEITAPYYLWSGATVAATFDNQFNYYEADGKTLSDTVEISGNMGDAFVTVNFLSDPYSLTPLPSGGNYIENGSWQPAVYPGVVSNGDLYNFQIASDVIPEPAAWTLMLLGVGAVGFAARRRALTA